MLWVIQYGSIPAWAGQPASEPCCPRHPSMPGLSPRGRGNLMYGDDDRPLFTEAVYPRVGGATTAPNPERMSHAIAVYPRVGGATPLT